MLKNYDWSKLRNANYSGKVYYSDCQVVSAVNAFYMLTGNVAYDNEREYRALCKLARACYGAAICIGKVHEKLGIRHGKPSWSPFDRPKFDCPIECTVWHTRYGFHSILIVDRVKKCDAIRVTNFKWETNSQGWMFGWDLHNFLESMNNDEDKRTERCFPLRLAS